MNQNNIGLNDDNNVVKIEENPRKEDLCEVDRGSQAHSGHTKIEHIAEDEISVSIKGCDMNEVYNPSNF